LETEIPSNSPSTTAKAQRTRRRADRRFVRLLLVGVALYVLAAITFALHPTISPTLAKVILLAIAGGGLFALPASGVVIVFWRRQLGGVRRRRTNLDALFCMAWSTLTIVLAQFSGFWGTSNPTPRLIITSLVAAAPLTVVAWLATKRGMASRRGLRRALPLPLARPSVPPAP
jgi:MFS family permease